MNYYIITNTKYDSINKNSIQFKLKSIDESKVLVVTTENISGSITTFSSPVSCSQYTFTNHSDWVGDGSGVETWEFEDMVYIPGIDD